MLANFGVSANQGTEGSPPCP